MDDAVPRSDGIARAFYDVDRFPDSSVDFTKLLAWRSSGLLSQI